MQYRQALNKTLEVFSVKASEISERSGVEESRLSKFRNGHHDLRSEALQSVVNSLPGTAKAYFYALAMSENPSEGNG